MKNHLVGSVFIGAALFMWAGCRAFGDSTNPGNAFTKENLLTAQAGDLKRTVVVATPDAPIEPGTNVIWCGTFQLAWNEACGLVGEDIHLENEPAMVPALNKKSFTSNELDSASHVALAGFVKDDILKKIHDEVAAKFGNSAQPVLIPDRSLTPTPNDIVAYAYLFKNLEFAVPFEGRDSRLNFAGQEVAAFSIAGDEAAQRRMAAQVLILDYSRPDGFVIELKTESPQDHLILAMIKPGKSLNETIQMVENQIQSGQREGCGPEDALAVPKFNFDITRTYSEIEGRKLVVRNSTLNGATVASAMQNIRFQMDEKGVRLKSEAYVAAAKGIHKMLIFDKPFLVMLKRGNAKAPYFAMWVDNPELLVQR